MNKEQLTQILESCLLHEDNLTEEQMIKKGINSQYARIGIKLNQYLQDKIK